MNSQMIVTAEMACAVFSLVPFVLSLVLFRKTRRLSRTGAEFEFRSNEELNALSTEIETALRKTGENSRRIAWLETRATAVATESKPVAEATSASPKATITERRHRVLSLARRGQDPQTIARTLGMPHGEVELMINLGRAA